MSKLFIIEGPDCSGKTSLAAAICAHRKAAYIHASGNRSLHTVMLAYHLDLIKTAVKNINFGQDVVMDRLWPSELIYGQILRPHISDRVYEFDTVLETLRPLQTTYIICGDPEMAIRHKEQIDDTHAYTDAQYSQICQAYSALEEEMRSDMPLPNFRHPKSPKLEFTVRHYSVLEHGAEIREYVEGL